MARLSQFFAPAQAARGNRDQRGRGQEGWRDRPKGEWRPRNGAANRPEVGSRNTPYVVVSQQMTSSPVHRGARTAVPKREALILQAALNYPWLLHDHLEELASLEFRHADAERLKNALIDIAAHAAAPDAEAIKAELSAPPPHRGHGAHRCSRSPRPRSGGPGRTPPPRMFWSPGSSLSPCIGNGIH